MDTIVEQLAQIEQRACQIKQEAEQQKAAMTAGMEKRIVDFDQKIEADTALALASLNKKLQAQTEADLAAEIAKSKQYITNLEAYFEQHHGRLADEVVAQVIGD
ncbi:MAG: hypothetical protein SPL15_05165 [Lachnospiraceae bacterium]|nr:hypothetical protein [Lachnospiraceae bacterium]MDY5742368.1 hypothetical protein [Lachnospiraceae bacterium]